MHHRKQIVHDVHLDQVDTAHATNPRGLSANQLSRAQLVRRCVDLEVAQGHLLELIAKLEEAMRASVEKADAKAEAEQRRNERLGVPWPMESD